jgi:hypothetical protein
MTLVRWILGAATAARCKLADLFAHQQTQSDIVMQQSLIVRSFDTWRVLGRVIESYNALLCAA